VAQTGRARTVNREKLRAEEVVQELGNPNSFRSRVFYAYIDLIKTRKNQPAFHPNAEFEIFDIDPRVFAIKRSCPEQTLYALTNISTSEASAAIPEIDAGGRMTDLLSGQSFAAGNIRLRPYQYLWLIYPQ
jgi:sucrose phosphorylase